MTFNTGKIINNRYRVVELLAEGGFGAVYKAWDININGPCALKHNLDSSAEAQRQFEREAQTMSTLSHANLPRVTDYFFIADLGQFLVMDYVEGLDLQTLMEQQGPISEEQALAWIGQIADALTYLHNRPQPIIHRDIKPANIRITPQDQAILVDFGLVKVYDKHLKTTIGARAVTPGYSPPEQYGQGNTDARTDIYALSATLYTLLTRHEPQESVLRIVDDKVAPARTVKPAVTAKTSGVIAKGMALRPTERYQTAADFTRELMGTISVLKVTVPPIDTSPSPLTRALPSSPGRQLASQHVFGGKVPKWALGVVGLGAFLLILAAALLFYNFQRDPIERVTAREVSVTPLTTAISPSTPHVESITKDASTESDAIPLIATGNSDPDVVNLGSVNSKTINLDNVDQITQLHRLGKGYLEDFVYSLDGKFVAVATALGVNLYDATTLKELSFIPADRALHSIAISPDGEVLAAGVIDGTVQLWRVDDGVLLNSLEGHTRVVQDLAFSPDGQILGSASTDNTVRLWRVSDGTLLQVMLGHEDSVQSIAFSSDGEMLATGSGDETARLWRVDDGEELHSLTDHEHGVTSVAFSPDGKSLATGARDGVLRLWQVSDGSMLIRYDAHDNGITSVAFSPDGETLASGSWDYSIRVWQPKDGELLQTLEGHEDGIYCIAFSPDGQTLASISQDMTMRFWDSSDGALIHILGGFTSWVDDVAYSPDSNTLVSGSRDDRARIWQIEDGALLRTINPGFPTDSVAISPDGSILAIGGLAVNLWRMSDGVFIRDLVEEFSIYSSVAFSPDGENLISGNQDGDIYISQVSDGKILHKLEGHNDRIDAVAYAPDGKTFATGSYDTTVRTWQSKSGESIGMFQGASKSASIAYSPDGLMLASGLGSGDVELWRVAEHEILKVLPSDISWTQGVDFSPDGSLLATGGKDNEVKLWRVSDGTLLKILEGHTDGIQSLAFAPNGTSLASASADGTVIIWGLTNDGGTSFESPVSYTTETMANEDLIIFERWLKCPEGDSDDASWGCEVELWSVHSDGSDLQRISQGDRREDVSFSPDREYIAYRQSVHGDRQISISTLDGDIVGAISKGISSFSPQWVDNETFIVTAPLGPESESSQSWRLVRTTGDSERVIDVGLIGAFTPKLSPSRQQVAFSAYDSDSDRSIYLLALDNQDVTKVETDGKPVFGYVQTWHPDGNHIVVSDYPNCNLVSLDGTRVTPLEGIGECNLSWSLDGSEIVYQYGSAIWIMDENFKNQQLLVEPDDESLFRSPVWSQ